MKPSLRPLEEQVIVITGASSGIGLATAEAAAARGARVVLAARSAAALALIVQRLKAQGGQAMAVECDVADRAQVEQVAAEAIARFGSKPQPSRRAHLDHARSPPEQVDRQISQGLFRKQANHAL